LEKKKMTRRRQGSEKSAISKKLCGDEPLTPDYLYELQREGIICLDVETTGSFLDFSVKKNPDSASFMWTRILEKLKACGFFEVVRGQWSNSWVREKWSDRVVF
jgi:hypothetical protein